jgi:hypothetical protein
LYNIDAHLDVTNGRRKSKPFVIDATRYGNVARFINHRYNFVYSSVLQSSVSTNILHPCPVIEHELVFKTLSISPYLHIDPYGGTRCPIIHQYKPKACVDVKNGQLKAIKVALRLS